jgi:branched-chain amino acid transport system permease protein
MMSWRALRASGAAGDAGASNDRAPECGAFDRFKNNRAARNLPISEVMMLASILASGLAVGAIYALIGITYNTMFATSRVMSFTAGQLGMLGGVFGSLFMLRLGWPPVIGLLATLGACALIGVVTEIVAVRPVLKSLEQHLYVLSTLALALMIQQVTAIEWSTEPQPFPKLFGFGSGAFDEKFWLPLVACALTIVGLEFLYRKTLVGRAFLAIAEDNFAASALGLPERNLRIASYALAGAIGGLAGFAGGQLLLAFFANGPLLNFYGFVPVALGGLGNNRGAVIGGLALGIFQQAANFLVGGIFSSVAVFALFIVVLLAAPQGLFGAAAARRV